MMTTMRTLLLVPVPQCHAVREVRGGHQKSEMVVWEALLWLLSLKRSGNINCPIGTTLQLDVVSVVPMEKLILLNKIVSKILLARSMIRIFDEDGTVI